MHNRCVFCLKKHEANKFGYLKFRDDVGFSFIESTNEVLNVATNISFIWGELIFFKTAELCLWLIFNVSGIHILQETYSVFCFHPVIADLLVEIH